LKLKLLLAACAALAAPLAARAATSCEDLAAHPPSDVRITSAAPVAPTSAYQPAPNAPPSAVPKGFCRVQGVIGREIGFELWLPEPKDWNGKLLGAGVGGDAGEFNFRDLPRGVALGYAAATTDTGHKAADRTWMLGPPERLTNFELTAEHRLAETAKLIVDRYYGERPRHSYFIGCSGGGRQALKELQRFPADYDGILAGAPGPKTPEMTTRRMWELLLREHHPGLLSPTDWKRVRDTAVKACDGQDGVADGVIADPTRCNFEPSMLACKPGAAAGTCLSPEQLALVEEIYAPLKDDHGRELDKGILPGVLVDSGRSRLAPATFGQAVRHQADWDGQGFDVSEDLAAIDRVMPELRADDTHIQPFVDRGGKLILYEGWSDPAVAARMIVDYYEAVEAALGPRVARRAVRLFMAPGMEHCMGGAGPDQFGGSGSTPLANDPSHDLLAALDAWVTKGRAPEVVIAAKIKDGVVDNTRPLCAWPKAARYDGRGDPDVASSFACAAPRTAPAGS
jgi:feruloyl esterase